MIIYIKYDIIFDYNIIYDIIVSKQPTQRSNLCQQHKLKKNYDIILSLHPATSREATKQLQPTPQVCRPPPIPSGRRGLIYGIRCGWRIPWSG